MGRVWDFSAEGAERRKAQRAAMRRQPFTEASADGTCPKCGGSDFTAKRSVSGKLLAAFFAPKTQVRCVTCGTFYKRA